MPFQPKSSNLFFQLVSSRYERASLIVTSNKQFGRWGEVFGDDVVAEDFTPAAELLVRGDDQGGSFIPAGHELEEQVRGFGFEGDVADLIDDEERVAAEADKFAL